MPSSDGPPSYFDSQEEERDRDNILVGNPTVNTIFNDSALNNAALTGNSVNASSNDTIGLAQAEEDSLNKGGCSGSSDEFQESTFIRPLPPAMIRRCSHLNSMASLGGDLDPVFSLPMAGSKRDIPVTPMSSAEGNFDPALKYSTPTASSKITPTSSRDDSPKNSNSASTRSLPGLITRTSSSNLIKHFKSFKEKNSSKSGLTPVNSKSDKDGKKSLTIHTERESSSKKIPYKPSKDQQAQIDKLHSKDAIALSAVNSHTQTMHSDVLPSFEMYQLILKRDNSQFNENLLVKPPSYEDTTSTTNSPVITPVPSSSSAVSISPLISPITNRLSTIPEQINSSNEIFDTIQQNHQVSGNLSSFSPLDQVYSLPKSKSSPLILQIFVTESVPQPDIQNKQESRLREYTGGDEVNGYVTIQNTSSNPVNFGMFTVTLEGTTKIFERKSDGVDLRNYTRSLISKFFDMHDLNASYGYTHVPSSSGITYKAYSPDSHDGTIIGLPTDRILLPKTTYKKFFTFKFPAKLEVDPCTHLIASHDFLPPSIGFDYTSFPENLNIEINELLGYGYMDVRGSPMITRDHSFDNVSISYTIQARFIDLVTKPVKKGPNNINDQRYEVSSSSQYFLRFISNLSDQWEYLNKSFDLESKNALGIDGKFMNQFKYLSTWRSINEHNNKLEKEIDDLISENKLCLKDLKQKNLYTTNNDTTSKSFKNIESKSRIFNKKISYEKMISDKVLIMGKKKSFLSSAYKMGYLKLYVKIPDKIISYAAPKLIQRNNGKLEMPGIDLKPVTSGMSTIYNRFEDEILSSLEIEVKFSPIGVIGKPIISRVDINVVLWSYYTESRLPFELGYDFFYESENNNEERSIGSTDIFSSNLKNIKNRVDNYSSFITENELKISHSGLKYLKSIEKLRIKKNVIKEYFASVSSEDLNENWRWENNDWYQKMQVPLNVVNKNIDNLLPTFQGCLVGRVYCLQVVVKFQGQNHNGEDELRLDVPVIVG